MNELVLDRFLDAPRALVWRCWTEPELLKQWFCPAPWRVSEVVMDVRAGGRMFTVMEGPNGERHENPGVFLEVVDGRRLVTTDAYVDAWLPSEKPFMTAIMEFADEGAGTRYRAVARHWTAADLKAHEEMGFHEGWGKASDQLEALARTLG